MRHRMIWGWGPPLQFLYFASVSVPACEGGDRMHEQITFSLLASKDMGRTGSQWASPCELAQNFWVQLFRLQVMDPKRIMDSKLFWNWNQEHSFPSWNFKVNNFSLIAFSILLWSIAVKCNVDQNFGFHLFLHSLCIFSIPKEKNWALRFRHQTPSYASQIQWEKIQLN